MSDLATTGGQMTHDYLEPSTMPLAMRIWFDDNLLKRVTHIAESLSKASGFVPAHLAGKPNACFAVVVKSLVWRLDPYAVAMATYITPGDKIGFEGKLCHAILEASGKIQGAVKYIHFWDVLVQERAQGDAQPRRYRMRNIDPRLEGLLDAGAQIVEEFGWDRIQGKFRKQPGRTGKEFAVADWKEADELGLGVVVRAQVKGEVELREFEIELKQCFPRNSTLWATDPKTQICYLAVRRFGSVAAPSLMMGTPFDRESDDDGMIDVTPPEPPRPPAGGSFTKTRTVEEAAAELSKQADPLKLPHLDLWSSDGELLGRHEAKRWASMMSGLLKGKPPEEVLKLAKLNQAALDAARNAGAIVEDIEMRIQDAADMVPGAADESDQGEPQDDGTDVPVQQETGQANGDPAPAGPAEADDFPGDRPTADDPPARNAAFYAGDSYLIRPPPRGKNGTDWAQWHDMMTDTARLCRTSEEVARLRLHNQENLSACRVARPDLFERVRTVLNEITQKLEG